MHIYGVAKYIFFRDPPEKGWEVVKIVRQDGKLVWRSLYIEEYKENDWWDQYNKLWKTTSLESFQKAFDFPYVGEIFYKYPLTCQNPTIDVDPNIL